MTPYKLMLALTSKDDVDTWLDLAARLLPEGGSIHLRGLVPIEAERSLSEGALPAREWREKLAPIAQAHGVVEDSVQVIVDYVPADRMAEEIQAGGFDLLLTEWKDLAGMIGGKPVSELLNALRCDVVLVSDVHSLRPDQAVLLSLRGGPNLSIGVRVARALAGEGSITLFHAIDQRRTAPDLEAVLRGSAPITRTVTAVTQIIEGIFREAQQHEVIVMGTGMDRMRSADHPDIFRSVYERTGKPVVLVRAFQPETLAFHAPRPTTQTAEPLSTRVDRWFAQNSFHSSEFDDVQRLLALKEKQGLTISIALPALNEEQTIENVIRTLKTALMDDCPLVDEMVLIDSASTDRTVEIARDCGIPVFLHPDILSEEVGSVRGKGEALWKSLQVTQGDLIVWVDTDITNIHPRFVYGLLGPLLLNPTVQYVKGFYTRPIEVGGKLQAYGGGRVTELVARPLLNLFYPELSGMVQPLSGEYAGRRSALEQVPFFSGYGVEIGLLIDLLDRFGLEAIAQSDLEVRVHYNQPLANLSKMSFAILQVLVARLESRYGVELLDKANRTMKLIVQDADRFALDIAEIGDLERPPILSLPAYRDRPIRQKTENTA